MSKAPLSVELRPAFADIDDSGQQTIAKELRHHIKSCIGVSVAVRIAECGQLERSIGKAKRVIDKR